MNKHLALGSAGEQLAAQWLQQKGYTILQQNFRWGKTEIDIVATKGEWLHIVEVKASSTNKWGTPEMRVDQKKMRMLQRAANFLLWSTGRQWIQYDVIAITWNMGQAPLIELIEDMSCK
jgi:putative endonuclease